MKNSNFKNGFTLTEILVIIGIIGILALIGIPAFRSFKSSLELSGIVRELVTDLRYAQQLTVTEQINHGVRFDFTENKNKYQIIKYLGTDGESEEILKEKSLPEGIYFQEIDNFNEAKFNPYGAAVENGKVRLVNTKTKTIDIRPSGFVKIKK